MLYWHADTLYWHADALAYADAQIRKGSYLIYNIWHCNTYIYTYV
jgi:hypothetical protein